MSGAWFSLPRMDTESTSARSRRFDDKQGNWWYVTWRDAAPESAQPAGYAFRSADGEEELFLEAGPGASAESLARLSLGDVRQILSVAKSGLV